MRVRPRNERDGVREGKGRKKRGGQEKWAQREGTAITGDRGQRVHQSGLKEEVGKVGFGGTG